MNSSNSLKVKNNMDKLYNTIFSPKDVIEILGVSPNTATKYINKFRELGLLEQIKVIGQSKYKFNNE